LTLVAIIAGFNSGLNRTVAAACQRRTVGSTGIGIDNVAVITDLNADAKNPIATSRYRRTIT
jgi:hypothetical protein